MRTKITPRHCFVAPKGFSILSADFKSQEVYIAGVLSQEPKILGSLLTEPGTLKTVVNGEEIEYVNPKADFHLLTAVYCSHRSLFEGKPEHEWYHISTNGSLTPDGREARKVAKILNFALLYDQTAKSMAQLNYVPESTAQEWINNHEKTYPQFHRWKRSVSNLASARGWMPNHWSGRIRFVGEDNAKGSGSDAGRSGLNFLVQGLAADIGKLALVRCYQAFKHEPGIKIRGYVHDEILFTVPGDCEPTDDPLVWTPSAEAKGWAEAIVEVMKKAESDILQEAVADYPEQFGGGNYPGLVTYELAPFWSH